MSQQLRRREVSARSARKAALRATHCVTLHLSETDAAAGFPAFDRLVSKRIDRASCAHLLLVVDHVAQPLVVNLHCTIAMSVSIMRDPGGGKAAAAFSPSRCRWKPA